MALSADGQLVMRRGAGSDPAAGSEARPGLDLPLDLGPGSGSYACKLVLPMSCFARCSRFVMNIDRLRSQLEQALQAHDEVELALLFGSRARGDAAPGSDVDVAVVGRAVDTVGLAIELSDALGLQVDVVDLSADPPIALLLAVLRDGVKIREGRPGAHGRFLSHALMTLETDLPGYRRMQRAFLERVAERGLAGGR